MPPKKKGSGNTNSRRRGRKTATPSPRAKSNASSMRKSDRLPEAAASVSAQMEEGPTKRARMECVKSNADDSDEDITLEQLGSLFLCGRSHARHESLLSLTPTVAVGAAPLTLSSSLRTTTTTTAAAVTAAEEGEERGSHSEPGAALPSSTVTPPRAGTTSPARLTSSNGRISSVLPSSVRRSGVPHAQFQSSSRREGISCDRDVSSENNLDIDNMGQGGIALSPVERPSTALIRKAAATRPAASPATLWICLDDDNDEDIKVLSCPPTPPRPCGVAEGHAVPALATCESPLFRSTVPPAPRQEPIAEVLPPTFRPRKGPLQANKPPPRTITPLPSGFFIHDDDFTDDDEDADGSRVDARSNAPPCPQQQPLFPPMRHLDVSTTTRTSFTTLPYIASQSFIKDDDNSSSGSGSLIEAKDLDSNNNDDTARQTVEGDQGSFSLAPSSLLDENASFASVPTGVGSSTRSVRDFLFSSRRHASGEWGDSSFSSFAKATTVGAAEPAAVAAAAAVAGAAGAATSVGGSGNGSDADYKRAVERLEPLFKKRFTRKCFLSTVESVVSKLHCLEPGEFWQAFESAEYVGEGSFGLVWRCRTVDGDLVAVKSCPISFHSRGSIDDAFSVLREIAIMRFLSEHEVPYVLPLHSAFFVQARETLPPDVVAAVEWKARLEEAEKERQRQRRLRRQQHTRRGRRNPHANEQAVLLGEEDEDEGEANATETAKEIAERLRHERVRMPRFLSITVEDAMECDATAFLVTELCDGDLESIERHDSITKGVAFCVGSALAAMHQLGLVHLDLKPSNILFAYENSPSQQQQLQRHLVAMHSASTPPSISSLSPAGGGGGGGGGGAMRVANTVSTPNSVKFYLSDFGNCRIVGPNVMDEVTGVFGTLEYMDSRALKDKTCSRATDCFSLGATLYELLYSRRLYPPCRNPKCVSEDDHTRHCYVEAAQQMVVIAPPPASTPSAGIVQKVLGGLLALDPRERWTAERCRSFFLIHGIAGAPSATPP